MRHEERLTGLEALTKQALTSVGVELVEMSLKGSSQRRILRIDIDRAGAAGVGIADCENASRALGDALEESELLPAAFVLEVSSPGIDRPIRTPDDVRRNIGRKIIVQLAESIGDETEIRGTLDAAIDGGMRVKQLSGEVTEIALEQIQLAQQDIDI